MTFKRILVTGASGFLGSAVVHKALNAGFRVTATDINERIKCSGMDFIPADILDLCSLSSLFSGVDLVCHVAGLTTISQRSAALRDSFHAVNVIGTENVAKVAVSKGVDQFIFISSVSVYGGTARCSGEDESCHPEGPYAKSKFEAEQYLTELCHKEGMNLTILRLATLYGDGDRGNVARLIHSIERNQFIWVGRGENLKSLLHRDDAARACIEVAASHLSGINIFNVSAPPCKMLDIVETIARALGKSVPSLYIPASFALNLTKGIRCLLLNRGRFSAIHDTLKKWLADDYYKTEKFCRTFNFQTQVSLEEGIRQEVEWYKTRQHN